MATLSRVILLALVAMVIVSCFLDEASAAKTKRPRNRGTKKPKRQETGKPSGDDDKGPYTYIDFPPDQGGDNQQGGKPDGEILSSFSCNGQVTCKCYYGGDEDGGDTDDEKRRKTTKKPKKGKGRGLLGDLLGGGDSLINIG